MDRRKFLRNSSLPLMLAAAGCTSVDSSSDSTPKDSDGDGVPDSEDYAPRDPDVQDKSDLNTTARPTTNSTPTTTESTPTPTPTPTTTQPTITEPAPANTIQANYEPIQDGARFYFKSYSLESARFIVQRAEDDESIQRRMKFAVFAQEYPEGSALDRHITDATTIEVGENEVSLTYQLDVDTDQPFYLWIVGFPADKTLDESLDDGSTEYLCETDRLKFTSGTLEKSQHPDAKDTLERSTYTRTSGEGTYLVSVSGEVEFGLTVYKQAFIVATNRDVERRTEDVVMRSYDNGLSKTLASIVHDAAEEAGQSSARQKVNYAISAIQQLPYVPDNVEENYDNHNKYPIETLVEAGGDCEDTVILLAAALLAEPFNYGMVLIYLPYESPTHIALGVRGGEDVEGTYYTYEDDRYYYVETTGEGWEVGEIPDEYTDMSARIVPLF